MENFIKRYVQSIVFFRSYLFYCIRCFTLMLCVLQLGHQLLFLCFEEIDNIIKRHEHV